MLPTSLLLLGAAHWNASKYTYIKLQGSLNQPYVNYIEDHHKFDCLKFVAITDFINDLKFLPNIIKIYFLTTHHSCAK